MRMYTPYGYHYTKWDISRIGTRYHSKREKKSSREVSVKLFQFVLIRGCCLINKYNVVKHTPCYLLSFSITLCLLKLPHQKMFGLNRI